MGILLASAIPNTVQQHLPSGGLYNVAIESDLETCAASHRWKPTPVTHTG